MSTDIAVELQKHGLDDTYWSRVFKDELNIVNLKPLAYLNQSEHKQIEKHVRQPWEKKALEEMINNQSRKQSESSEYMVNSMDSFKTRQKEVSQGLTDLEKLFKEGRDRSDARVRGMEEKVRVALDVPKESWMHTGQTLKDVVENIYRQLGVLKNTPSSVETISDESVLKSSSGGLALEGIYKTGNLKDLLGTRQQLIEVPESFSLNRPKQNVMYQSEEFSSHNTQRTFQKVIEKCGFSFGSTLKVGFKGFGLENTVVSDTSTETEEINRHSSEQSCICNTRYNCVPLASCFLEKAQLRLTQGAMAELKEMEKLILYTEDNNVVKNKVSTFFLRYGSHVNQGPIHFGGVFWWTASAEGFKDSDLSEMKSLTSEALDNYVGAGYSGPCFNVSAGVKTASSELKGDCTGKHNEALMSLVQLSISKTGGPAETDDHLQWKSHLVNSNKTWSVIDRGTLNTLIPIWEIVMSAHRQDFTDPLKLSTKLMETFADITKLTVVPMWGEDILLAEESATKVTQLVNSWTVSDGEKHLTELLKIKTSLKETTKSETLWVQKYLSNETLQDYLLDVAKNNSDTGAVNLRCLMRSLMKSDVYTVEHFPNRTLIINWAYQSEADVSNVISVSDFAELNKHLQCAKNELEDSGSSSPEQLNNSKVKANCTTALSLNALCQTLRESGQEEVELLMLTIIMAFGYNRESKAFNHLLDLREINFLQAKLQNAYDEYSSLSDLSVERAQAFLVVTALTASSDEDLNVPVNEKGKRLQFVKSQLKDGISTSIKSAIEGTDWETIEKGLNSIIDEKELDDKGIKAEEILKSFILNSKVTFSEVQETEQKTEPAITVDIEKTHSFMSLLQKLGLLDLYSKKMKQRDVLVIDTLCQNIKPPETERELSSQYLYKLMMLDYRARFLFYKPEASATISESNIADVDDFLNCEESTQDVHIDEKHIHPMDIHMAVFHCANDFLRQYMFSKLSSCQFGLPLLVPNPCTQEVEFPLWALRNIKKSWQSKTQSTTDSPSKYKSRHMFNTPVPVVSFIRLGNSSISKSQILNSVISKQKHSVFYHRHCEGSTPDSLLMDGVVEITWYCPSGKEDDTFDDCVAFLNLHGDATDHPKQFEFMRSVTTVNVILVSEQPLEEKAKEIIKNLSLSPVPLVAIFSGQERLSSKTPTKVRLAAKNRNEAELAKEIISNIQHGVKTHNKITSIEEFCNEARKHQFKVDEDMQICRDGHKYAQTLVCLLTEENSLKEKLKEKLLPLQGKLWHDWCQKDKERYRLKCKGEESLENQSSVIDAKKKCIRKKQLKAALAPSDFMRSFIDCLTSPDISQDTKLYMMQWLRILLDEFNMSALAGLEEEYHSTWEIFKCGPQVEGDATDEDTMQKKLSIISGKMNATTIGLQHIMRETGQMYEALESSTEIQQETIQHVMALPEIGAEMLISGLPLELMDGDAAQVPVLWIEAVLNLLTKKLGNKKVFVLSVLGLQSSGKSTLLNAMFGLQFTVSAGRCTKGAFMQLIKVDSAMVDKLKYEYVLVVDTEGLRSPELNTNTSLSHDNEMATFIIGIGDMTIINIMGENPSEMHDILQICVQALLRMKMVRIKPSCIFVHQNVAEASAGAKNMEGRINLLQKLNTMAVTAAKNEQIDNVTGFSDIIKFDVKTQVFYFKGLLEGDPPMAPPNPSYSQNVQELKEKVLTMAQWKSDCRFSTLSEVKVRIMDLWHGLLKENFVFSFRNTLEMMVYSELENKFSEWSWKLRKHSMEKENELHNQIGSNKRVDVNRKDLIVEFDKVYNPLKGEVEAYFTEDKNPEILIQWRVNIDKRLENLKSELIDGNLKKCRDVIAFKKSTSQMDQRKSDYEAELLKMSKDMASKLKNQRLTEQQVEKHFNSIWVSWTTKVAKEKAPEKEVSVRAEVDRILQQRFHQLKDINDKIAKKSGPFQFEENKHIQKSFLGRIFSREIPENNSMQFTQQVTSSVEKYITGKTKTGRDFSDIFIHEILSSISGEIQNCADSKQIKFTKEYEADLSIHLCIQAVKPFQRMHSLFIKTMDPLTYLDSKREQYLQMFKNFCKGANSVTIFADFLCKQLKPAIKLQGKKKTIISISDLLKSNHQVFSGNRSNLENHILKHLAQKKHFEDYVEYIEQPNNYFERFIREQVKTSCDNKTFSRMLNENLESLMSLILIANTNVTTEVIEQHGNAAEWLDKFCDELGNHMEIKREDLVSIENEEISGLAGLKEIVGKSLDEMVMQLKKENLKSVFDSALTDQVTEHLFASSQGCWAQCPFCNVTCTNTIPGHEGDHSVTFHRSKALKGRYWKDTDQFSIDFCTTSVSSDDSFKCGSDYMPYKTYKLAGNPYNEWSITADNSTLRYWKWFIVQFESQWEKKYGLKFAGKGAIPCDWKTITLESALEEIK